MCKANNLDRLIAEGIKSQNHSFEYNIAKRRFEDARRLLEEVWAEHEDDIGLCRDMDGAVIPRVLIDRIEEFLDRTPKQ